MIIQLKYFHDSLNIVEILAPDREFFSAKYVQLPLIFRKLNKVKDVFLPELLSFIFEITLSRKMSKVIKIVYYFVSKEKYCQICKRPI